jgi:hypothetical protein
MRVLLVSAIAAAGVAAKRLDDDQRQALFERLRANLGVSFDGRRPWDHPDAPDGVRAPDAWRTIPELVGDKPCLCFLEDTEEVWRLQGGADLRGVLGELPAVEFYACDEVATWLLCHNHHDFLIGWGSASDLVSALAAHGETNT